MNRIDALDLLAGLLTDERERDARRHCAEEGVPAGPMIAAFEPLSNLIDLDAVASRVFEVTETGEYRLAEWADLAQITAVAEQHERERLPVETPADLPCPPWCDKPAGHPFVQSWPTNRRVHVHRFGVRGSSVMLEQIERCDHPALGVTDLGIDPAATTIRMQFGPGQVAHIAPSGARRVAAQLIAAADLYDENQR